MSSCEKYQELISRMVDGDLSQKEQKELLAHIETCPECAALYQAFSLLSEKISGELEESPLDLRDNVMAEIRREEIHKRNRLPTILRAVMSAAACLAVIVGVYLGVSLTRGNHLNTAAFQSGEAAAAEEKAIAAPTEALEEKPAAPQLAAGDPAPAEEPESAEEAPRQFADSAAAPEAVKETGEELPAAAEAANALDAAPAAAPAEEPAPEEDAAPVDEAEEELDEEPETFELRGWDLSLLRSLLGGSPAEREAEELKGCLRYRILLITEKQSLELPVYELDGVLYYLDPVEETLYQAELTPEELDLFLHS